uniref:Uncharacterized protein n=1 Tax=Glossina palpalis gambiensis TaxID=67801 RepID=A0A1B0AS25_9MUSC
MLADENVISGCEWGNMLLWEAGLIKFEITRKGVSHAKSLIKRALISYGFIYEYRYRVWIWLQVGVIRQIYVDLKVQSAPTIHLMRAIKAHTAAVTKMTINPRNSLMVTEVADCTIFIYNLSDQTISHK